MRHFLEIDMSWKFKSSDFEGKVPWDWTAGQLREGFTDVANAKLEEWKRDATVVWLCKGELQTVHLAQPVDATHSALLIDITEMPKKLCEHEATDFKIPIPSGPLGKHLVIHSTFVDNSRCRFCNVPLQAKWEQVGE